jgi:hypothetical protein
VVVADAAAAAGVVAVEDAVDEISSVRKHK